MSNNSERIRIIILWAITLLLIMMWSPDIRLLRTTLRGTLSSGEYPVPAWGTASTSRTRGIGDIMVLETNDTGLTKRYFLSADIRSRMLYASTGGNTPIGGMIADEWTKARQEGRLVEIIGQKWTDFYNGTRYSCLHIKKGKIVG